MRIQARLFFILFCLFYHSILFGLEKKLESRHVIIRSSYQEKKELPKIDKHFYDLQAAGEISAPYYPEFRLRHFDLPEDFPQNVPIGWLAQNLGGLAQVFQGAQGALEVGALHYQAGNYSEAVEAFQAALNSEPPLKDKASLWLSWTLFKLGRSVQSTSYAEALLKNSSATIKKEALYLLLLQQIKKGNIAKLDKLFQSAQETLPSEQWGIRNSYIYLVHLLEKKEWQKAHSFYASLKKSSFSHTRLYRKLEEINGIIAYFLNDYEGSLNSLYKAKSLEPNFERQYQHDRRLLWLLYLTGKSQSVARELSRKKSNYWNEYKTEIQYLKVLTIIEAQDWKKAETELNKISGKSKFYTYAAFLVRSNLKKTARFSRLFNQVATLNYRFPEMKRHVSVMNGNQFFREGKFKQAQTQYNQALSINSPKNWITRYNSGLVMIHLEQYKKASKIFTELLDDKKAAQTGWIPYHLLYIHYQQGQVEPFLKRHKASDLSKLPKENQVEAQLMLGGVYLSQDQYQKAIRNFLQVWEKSQQAKALEHAAKAYYRNRQYQEVINLTEEKKRLRSDTLFSYRVKSLLGLREFEAALKEIQKRQLKGEEMIQLRLEVWLANRQYEKIIARIKPLLRKAVDREKRLFYYLTMGDAYFNQQEYPKSKSQFFKALPLAQSNDKKSMVYYNIVLSTFFNDDEAGFLKEIKKTLQIKELTNDIRFNLTQLLADHYLQKKELKKADQLLKEYTKSYSYQRAQAHFKRVNIYFQSQSYKKCFLLAQERIKEETSFQKVDRIILSTYCSKGKKSNRIVAKQLQTELDRKDQNYRKDELKFLLSKVSHNLEKYKQSLKLLKELQQKDLHFTIRFQTQLLLSDNYLKLNKPDLAAKELGPIEQYRKSNYYPDALLAASNIKLAQNRENEGIRSLLRIYYLKSTPQEKKQELLFKIIDYYLTQEKNIKKAKRFFRLIKPETLKGNKKHLSKYKEYQKTIS